MTTKILQGDSLEALKTLPDKLVHCCVTSPPYWSLRDYGTAIWEGGDAECDHQPNRESPSSTLEGGKATQGMARVFRDACGKCEAVRVDLQLGLEQTPDCNGAFTGQPCGVCYVCKLVAVFHEVKRVLRDDGTLWLNLGDSYASNTKGSGGNGIKSGLNCKRSENGTFHPNNKSVQGFKPIHLNHGLKPKDLVGIPWRVAFALQADGWWLRQDIIWAKAISGNIRKGSAMPESVRDRFCKSHEYIFLFSKSAQYYFDSDAVADILDNTKSGEHSTGMSNMQREKGKPHTTAIRRSVWLINPQPYPEAHFATYPEALVEPCILAGTSAKGICSTCGAPWQRVIEKTGKQHIPRYPSDEKLRDTKMHGPPTWNNYATVDWQPSCTCEANKPIPATVLDPFLGSGTTLAVAVGLGRGGIGIELNPTYITLAEQRIANKQPPLFG